MDLGTAATAVDHRRDDITAATAREHLLTVAFGLWMTVGLFLDGYSHENLEADGESFLTPWHVVFYAGFGASVAWLATMSRRRSGRQADWLLRFLPPGYDGARLGIALFGLGGFGDAVWHTAFGVERGIDALLSPTHLLLFAGLMLILNAPLRATRAVPASSAARGIVLGSVISATALLGFFLNFAWGLGNSAATRVAYHPVIEAGETELIAGIASTLVTTAVLFGAAKVLLVTGRVPPGALTVLFGSVALLVSVAFDEDAEGVVAAIVAGAVLDGVRARLSPSRRMSHPACFAVAAGTLWLVYFALLIALDGIAWQAEVWLGAVVLNALAGYAIAALPSLDDHAMATEGSDA